MKGIGIKEYPPHQGDDLIYGHTVAEILHAMRTLVLEVSTIKENKLMFPMFANEACELSEKINQLHNKAIVRDVMEKEKKGLIKSVSYEMTREGLKRIS
tara:strand:- start:1597 stop:1893 length:297 start_codon:yes stop_codon:yes gene_type:complete